MTIITRNSKETEVLGARISRNVPPGSVLALRGELGAGKTTFVRGFLRAFGIRRAVSPTFVIAKTFRVRRRGIFTIIHADLYRLPAGGTLAEVGLAEALNDPTAITLIEWADRLVRLPRTALRLRFAMRGTSRRAITLPAVLATTIHPTRPGRSARVRRRTRARHRG
ncbi:MAG: tRNA (adenosine(37)-N6)-threonylcarbamoyltransferase complex ATPase subunit type 1 TsaE [Candidatus Kerfeldbacteria bacterium]|nr:tRNA (adenosine(37)-N6)-threonylcarbamoyltransferase complex ATPase subunit type 1 TsaE [Candidatus Kerfeldbacteria bacterium]